MSTYVDGNYSNTAFFVYKLYWISTWVEELGGTQMKQNIYLCKCEVWTGLSFLKWMSTYVDPGCGNPIYCL